MRAAWAARLSHLAGLTMGRCSVALGRGAVRSATAAASPSQFLIRSPALTPPPALRHALATAALVHHVPCHLTWDGSGQEAMLGARVPSQRWLCALCSCRAPPPQRRLALAALWSLQRKAEWGGDLCWPCQRCPSQWRCLCVSHHPACPALPHDQLSAVAHHPKQRF